MKTLIKNIKVVQPTGTLENHLVLLEGNRIIKILPEQSIPLELGPWEEIDGAGAYLVPGFIDIHSDNIEASVQPRPTSVIDFELAMMEHEKQLMNMGITTMYHSLTLMGNEENKLRDKEARKPERMKELVDLIREYSKRHHLIRHKFHCRFDVRNVHGYETLLDYMEKGYIQLLSFNDHTPGQGQYWNLDQYRYTMKKYRPDLEDGELERMIQEKMATPKVRDEDLEKVAKKAKSLGIPVASHDDDSFEKLDYVTQCWGVNISEFPIRMDVARKAKELGMLTVAGAPNVLLGYSHSGNLSAVDAILDGCVDILCSDYYPPSMLHGVFKLEDKHGLPLHQAINLVTANPAKALGIEQDYGSVEEGKIADLLLIEKLNGQATITGVIIDGRLVSRIQYRHLQPA